MFQIFPNQADDLLDVAALPPTDKTELNYRTRPLSTGQELRLTLLVLLVTLPLLTCLGVTLHFVCSVIPGLRHAVVSVGVLLAGWIGWRKLTGALQKHDLYLGLTCGAAIASCLAWHWSSHYEAGALRFGLIISWVVSSLIARQVAAWILVAPTVDDERMKRWRVNLPQVIPHGLSLDCPELLTYTVSPLLLLVSWYLSLWLLIQIDVAIWFWPITFAASVQAIWLMWHLLAIFIVPFPSPDESLKATWRAIVVFITYDIYHTPAAGVFRFPTRWLRSPWNRWAMIAATLVAIGFGYGVHCPSPIEVLRAGGSFSMQLLANLVLIGLTGPLVLFATLWLTAGTLLVRFEKELSKHRDDETTDWDNYVDRIVNSNDKLEREHLFIGTSETSDYPILVHRDIHDQHGHILGDSGASKTALAMGPQATQLIARADSTVVIIDLKGDKALFESCRREAARTRRLRFRWISNEVGKTTFGFNPFMQSHNAKLSVEQLTQQLLQGLSLDYGIQYGAGYFTAMNEIVLNNVLRETGAHSFKELSGHLADISQLHATCMEAKDHWQRDVEQALAIKHLLETQVGVSSDLAAPTTIGSRIEESDAKAAVSRLDRQIERDKKAEAEREADEAERKRLQDLKEQREAELLAKATSPEVKMLLAPFLEPRTIQPSLSGTFSIKWVRTYDKMPMSLGKLMEIGVLDESELGLKKLALVIGNRKLPEPKWSIASQPNNWSPEDEERLKQAQQMLRDYGPTLVKAKWLSE